MSTITSGTTSGQAIAVTGDTSGDLVFTVNNTTVSVTFSATGAVGFGPSASYGTAGSILTSGGSGAAPTWVSVLPATNGGTGLSSPGASGNVLTSNGTSWVSQAAVVGAESFVLFVNGGNTMPGDPQSALGII